MNSTYLLEQNPGFDGNITNILPFVSIAFNDDESLSNELEAVSSFLSVILWFLGVDSKIGFVGTSFDDLGAVLIVVGGCGGRVITFFTGVVGSDGTGFTFDLGGVAMVVCLTGRGIDGLRSLTVGCDKPVMVGSHADLTLLSALAIRFLSLGSPCRILVRFDNILRCDTGSDSVPSIVVRLLVDVSYSDFKVGSKYVGGLSEIFFDGGCHTRSRTLDETD